VTPQSLTRVMRGPTATERVSLSMPIQQPHHRRRAVDPFLEGLLPDRADTRDAMGRALGVSGRNPFALLARVGLDCAGTTAPFVAVGDLLILTTQAEAGSRVAGTLRA
jgi:HipA-like protein